MAVSLPIVSEFDSKGVKAAIQEFKQLEGVGAKAQFALKKAAIPAGIAVAGVGAALVSATKAAMDDAQAQELLAQALVNTTGATEQDIAATEDAITAMSLATGVADDQLRPAFANLARGTNDLERSQKLMSVALDISAATGKDLESVTIALSKAEQGQYTALQRLGIPLGENTKSLQALEAAEKAREKALEKVIDLEGQHAAKLELSKSDVAKMEEAKRKLADAEFELAEASKLAGDFSADLAETFGGAAAAKADTFAGKMQIMKIQLDETKESIGAALLPVLEKLLGILQPLANWATQNTEVFLVLAGVVGGLGVAVLAVNAAMKVYQATLVVVKAAQLALNFVMSANPIGLVVIALAALAAAFVVAYQRSEEFRNFLQTLFEAVQKGVEFSLDLIKGYLNGVLSFYRAVFNGIARLWNSTVGQLSFTFPDWVPGLGGRSFSAPRIPELAEGGIVTGPTLALIGERGPEAVIPLNRANPMGGVTINVYSTIADASLPDKIVNALRQYNRRNGVIDIRVA